MENSSCVPIATAAISTDHEKEKGEGSSCSYSSSSSFVSTSFSSISSGPDNIRVKTVQQPNYRKHDRSSMSDNRDNNRESSTIKRKSQQQEHQQQGTRVPPSLLSPSLSKSKCLLAGKCVSSCVGHGHVCPVAAQAAGQAVCLAIKKLTTDSALFSKDGCRCASTSCHTSLGGESRHKQSQGDADCSIADHNDNDPMHNLPQINCSDLVIGKKLGSGGFSEVHQVSLLQKNHDGNAASPTQPDFSSSSSSLSSSVSSIKVGKTEAEGKSTEYAIKFLKRVVMVNQRHFKLGAADLAVEAHFLHILRHRNIVSLHGVTAGSLEHNISSGRECGFFIVIDRLYETLEHRIHHTWKLANEELNEQHQRRHLHLTVPGGERLHHLASSLLLKHNKDNNIFCIAATSNKCSTTSEYNQKRIDMLLERLDVATDICRAMEYLHGLHIVFRDLKPDNIGFDRCDVVKLFDFGLAKELRPSLKSKLGRQQGRQKQEEKSLHLDQHTTTANKNNDISDCKCTYQLTGKTGSRRYMAPEVALERPYNQSVDVYSFGILLWEICSLEKPFMGYSALRHEKAIVCGNERPSIATWWPVPLQWLMKRCWSNKHLERPNFKQILCTLSEVMKLCKHHSAHESTALHVKESLYFSSKPCLYKKSFAPRPTTKVRPCRSDESSSYSSPQAASYHTRAGLIAEGDKLSKLRLAAKLNDDNSFEPTETQSIESVQEEDKKSQSSKSTKVCRTSTSKRMMQPSSTTYNPKQSHDEQNKGGWLSFWK